MMFSVTTVDLLTEGPIGVRAQSNRLKKRDCLADCIYSIYSIY